MHLLPNALHLTLQARYLHCSGCHFELKQLGFAAAYQARQCLLTSRNTVIRYSELGFCSHTGLNLAHGKIATLSGDEHLLTHRPVCMQAKYWIGQLAAEITTRLVEDSTAHKRAATLLTAHWTFTGGQKSKACALSRHDAASIAALATAEVAAWIGAVSKRPWAITALSLAASKFDSAAARSSNIRNLFAQRAPDSEKSSTAAASQRDRDEDRVFTARGGYLIASASPHDDTEASADVNVRLCADSSQRAPEATPRPALVHASCCAENGDGDPAQGASAHMATRIANTRVDAFAGGADSTVCTRVACADVDDVHAGLHGHPAESAGRSAPCLSVDTVRHFFEIKNKRRIGKSNFIFFYFGAIFFFFFYFRAIFSYFFLFFYIRLPLRSSALDAPCAAARPVDAPVTAAGPVGAPCATGRPVGALGTLGGPSTL
jgi:hypothetical protein